MRRERQSCAGGAAATQAGAYVGGLWAAKPSDDDDQLVVGLPDLR